MIDWGWIGDHVGAIAGRTVQHLWLAGIAVAIGFAISFALAIWSLRSRRIYDGVTAVSGILYTIPSLAMFAALVPITGLSVVTAEVPLILYTLVIFVRNIVAGLESTPSDVREAAAGMGCTPRQRLWQVEIPLAIPLIVAGLRLASVSTIGLVTISGTIGDNFGGLGFFILDGYARGFPTEMYTGAVPSILLAIAADVVLVRIQRRITPWSHAGQASSVGDAAGDGAGSAGGGAGGGAGEAAA
ncbi:MAG TPA: ABC transporter permease [Candidatus Saccharimonadales bacterium]|nr:ABC transporter permease [Candidatus Saccharimonadales bacterium]